MTVSIITDSACGLSREDVERLGIRVVPLYLQEGGTARPETEIDVIALHERLAAGPLAITTSQPAPSDFADAFSECSADGVVAVLISSKMSSTYQSAHLGIDLARERGCATRVVVVDSESNSMQEGFAVLAAAERAAGGGDADECAEAARHSVARSRFLFAPRSLEYLAAGGRISSAAALLGSAIKIVPVLTASAGSTGVAGVARSRRQALKRIVNLFEADKERCGVSRVVVQAISHFEDARAFARDFIEPIVGTPVPVAPVAASIAVHVGPAIGLAYETVDPLR